LFFRNNNPKPENRSKGCVIRIQSIRLRSAGSIKIFTIQLTGAFVSMVRNNLVGSLPFSEASSVLGTTFDDFILATSQERRVLPRPVDLINMMTSFSNT